VWIERFARSKLAFARRRANPRDYDAPDGRSEESRFWLVDRY